MNHHSPAERLLISLGVKYPQDIDLEGIAFNEGAYVKYRPLNGSEARIVGRGDNAVITVSNKVTPARRRFSVGHELGHWHHHRGKTFVCRTEDIGNRTRNPLDPERIADAYAADLLLPRYIFEPLAEQSKRCSFDSIELLRKEFKTSITATAIRMVEYGPEPAMLICHSKNGRKWFNRPNYIPEKWFPHNDLNADSYAFDVLFGQSDRSRRVRMPADCWFNHWSANKYEVYEESLRISDEQILTLIVFKDEDMIEEE